MPHSAQPEATLAELASLGLLRKIQPLDSAPGPQVVRNGKSLWNFAANDYLGLATHPELAEAMIQGVRDFGPGATAARLVCGTQPPHQRLEEELAAAKHTDAALVFSSGFATPIGVIPAIVGPGDVVVLDKLCHACLVDGARLSNATLRVFPHNHTKKLRSLLSGIRAKSAHCRILIATESVFSMDGDLSPLREINDLAHEFSALLLVDEAHGFGVLGPTGMGLAEQLGLQSEITFQMGTLSKAAGISGGYIAASRPWIDLLVNRARSFVFSTSPPPALAHAGCTALRLIQSAEGARRRETLLHHSQLLGGGITPIHPRILGTNEAALAASAALESAGFLVPAIRYPTVPRGSARLRISLSAAHPSNAVKNLRRSLDRQQSAG
jgi:8-amino-7-oxononanoate synthase